MLKAEDLDGPLSLVDAIINKLISVNELQDTGPPFYSGSAIRHGIKVHRKIDKLEACLLRGISVVGCYVLNDAREVFCSPDWKGLPNTSPVNHYRRAFATVSTTSWRASSRV